MDLNTGVPTLFAYCEKLMWKFFFKFNQDTCPWMAFSWIFFRDFSNFLEGGFVGQIIYREYVVFRDSDISCSLHGLSLLAMETAGETQRDGEPCFLVCSLCNWTHPDRTACIVRKPE